MRNATSLALSLLLTAVFLWGNMLGLGSTAVAQQGRDLSDFTHRERMPQIAPPRLNDDHRGETNRDEGKRRPVICRGGRLREGHCHCPPRHIRLRVGKRRFWCLARRQWRPSPPLPPHHGTRRPHRPTRPGTQTERLPRPPKKAKRRKTVIIRTPDRVIVRNPGGPVHQKIAKIPKMCSGGLIRNRQCVCRAGKQPQQFAPGRFRCVPVSSPAGPVPLDPATPATATDAPDPDDYVPDEILVRFPANADTALINAVAADFDLTVRASQNLPLLGQKLVKFRIPPNQSLETLAQRLGEDPRTEGISFNYRYDLSQQKGTPASQRKATNTPASGPPQYALTLLNLSQAHAIATGKNIRIGVIDSAIDIRHPALRTAIKKQFDATGRPASGPALNMKHGTAVASLIAGRQGMRGAAPKAQLYAIRAFWHHHATGAPRSTSFVLAKAVGWAVAEQIQLLNLSFTGPADPLLERLLAKAAAKGVFTVAAAGNGGPSAPAAYPAAYGHVLAVTAVDAQQAIYRHANRGDYIAVAAPGVDVFVAAPHGGYDLLSGTSMAAALVTGSLALLLERQPNITSRQLREALLATARDLGAPGRDSIFGAGLVNAQALLVTTARHSKANNTAP